MKPDEIERSSFQIIDQEAGSHHYTEQQWSIVRRIIHTTADFEFKDMVRFHPDALSAGIDAIRNGKMIVTDTNMARVGIRRKEIEQYRFVQDTRWYKAKGRSTVLLRCRFK